MDPQKIISVIEELKPHIEVLEESLVNKDLREYKLSDLNEIMIPFDAFMEIFIKYQMENYVLGVQFINELLGEIAVETISHYTGLSYVLSLYEIMQESLENASKGIDSSLDFGRKLHQVRGMFLGAQNQPKKVESESSLILQDAPSSEVLEDGSISDFINEVIEGLEMVEETLMELEDQHDRTDLIDSIFRVMHTIKGTSGFLGMPHIGKIAHRTEDMLGEVRDGKRALGPTLFELMFASVDTLKRLVDQLREIVEGSPDPEPVDISEFRKILDVCELNPDGKGEVPMPLDEDEKAMIEAAKEEAAQGASGQGRGESSSGEAKSGQTSSGETPKAEAQAPEAKGPKRGEAPKKAKVQEMLKVPADRLDELSSLVGEFVVALSLLEQNPSFAEIDDRSVHAQMDHLEKITEALRDKVLGIRMFPISSIFTKLSRQVRDLSHKSGKKVFLHVEGAETLVDKMIIDNIYPPLIHIIRNSIDHGLEPPEERGSKDETGLVKLIAQHLGDAVEIRVEDDGRGLDSQKILSKAIEKGLAQPGRHYSDKEVYNFIFMAGFSTAKKITDISGRGVGLDVVKKTLESLRGKITIESELGRGTQFRLKLPLTTSIIEGLVVRVGDSRFIVPILDVYQTITPEEKALKGVQARKSEFFLFHEEMVPIIRLHEVYGLKHEVDDPAMAVIIVVQVGPKKFGLMVDDLMHRQQVVIQNLSERFVGLKGVTGGTILGDGRVGLILDPVGLLTEIQRREEQTELKKELA